jgi:hypothetical protein
MSVFTNPASRSIEQAKAYTAAVLGLLGTQAPLVNEFATLRQANLRLLERASADDLSRVGVHAERGEESVAHMIRLYAGHDLLHLKQLERIRQRF